MQITELRIDNFLRIKAVAIKPDGSVIDITGKNGAGKSSVLRAIVAALGGEGESPDVPIRQGETQARVVVDLGDFLVTRTWTKRPDGSTATAIKVTAGNGAVFPSPQKMLSALLGKLSFDPIAFIAPKFPQAETLRKLTGLDTSALDKERAALYAERTQVGRDGQLLKGVADGIVVPTEPVAPVLPEAPALVPVTDEVSVSALVAERQAMSAQITANEAERRAIQQERSTGANALIRAQGAYDAASATVKRLTDELTRAKQALDVTETAQREADADAGRIIADTDARLAALVDPDTSTLDAQIANAERDNALRRELHARNTAAEQAHARAVDEARAAFTRDSLAREQQAQRKAKAQAEVDAKREEYRLLGARIDKIDADKLALISAAKMPVEGLGLDGDVVTFGGLPLSQASHSQQIRVAVAISAALSPTLQIALVDEASSLDEDSLALLTSECKARGVQIWMTRVAHGEPCGIVIEDGEIATAPAAPKGE